MIGRLSMDEIGVAGSRLVEGKGGTRFINLREQYSPSVSSKLSRSRHVQPRGHSESYDGAARSPRCSQ